jgi:carbon-monoxide dehydrogenase medium subunit
MHRFDYFAPTTVEEAVNFLRSKGGDGKVIAGGTDLVPQMKERGLHPEYIVSLNKIPELRGIEDRGEGGLRIGAAERVWPVRNDERILRSYNAVAQGIGLIGSIQTQNLATIVGNIVNAIPSADGAPAVIAFGATATVVGPSGTRTVLVQDIPAGVGRVNLAVDEIVTELILPAPAPHSGSSYIRFCNRKEMDIAVAGVATFLTLDDEGVKVTDARICLSAVAPVLIRATAAEQVLVGKELNDATIEAAAQAAGYDDAKPITDARGSADFRRYLIKQLTVRTIQEAAREARGGAPHGPHH